MSDCVCGGSTERPNDDCERCQLVARIADLEAKLEQLRITLATVIYLDPESEEAPAAGTIAYLQRKATPTMMGGMDWRRWKEAIDAAFPNASQVGSGERREED
jgi:hypothetical protein